MPTSHRRVVITGLGLISPVGCSKDALWDALSLGRSGVGKLEAVPSKFLPTHVAAEAREFTGDIENFGTLEKEQKKAIRKGLKVMCRECQMGVAAAQLALADAGFAIGGGAYDPERSGCIFGADYMLTMPEEFSAGINRCRNPAGSFEYERWATEGMPQLSPLWLLKYLPNMPASHVAIYNDLRGPNNSITHREAAANLAIGEAYRTIVRGSAETMVVGATGTRVHPMKTVHAIQTEELVGNGVEPSKASRPFDKNRSGMVIGEGAGAIASVRCGRIHDQTHRPVGPSGFVERSLDARRIGHVGADRQRTELAHDVERRVGARCCRNAPARREQPLDQGPPEVARAEDERDLRLLDHGRVAHGSILSWPRSPGSGEGAAVAGRTEGRLRSSTSTRLVQRFPVARA